LRCSAQEKAHAKGNSRALYKADLPCRVTLTCETCFAGGNPEKCFGLGRSLPPHPPYASSRFERVLARSVWRVITNIAGETFLYHVVSASSTCNLSSDIEMSKFLGVQRLLLLRQHNANVQLLKLRGVNLTGGVRHDV